MKRLFGCIVCVAIGICLSCDQSGGGGQTPSTASGQGLTFQQQREEYVRQLEVAKRHLEETDRQLAQSESNLERAKIQVERLDELQARWKAQADRFDRILERWEKILEKMEQQPRNPQ